jgi:NADH-quinone oxidoreductase subunit N
MGEFNVWTSLPAVAPEIGLTILAAVILLLDAYLPQRKHRSRDIAFVAAAGMAALALTPFIWAAPVGSSELFWGGMIRHDALGQIFTVMLVLGGAITCLIAIEDSGAGKKGEFHLIIIIAVLGGCLMAKAADLVMVFVALETLSIPLYMLAAFKRTDGKSAESGLKYFLFGSFASAIFLYGLSLLFGFTGVTGLAQIAAALNSGAVTAGAFPVLLALVLIIVGFSFKISAVPFHFWTPDVYEGAPTPVTAFLSTASKAASFMLLLRFLIEVFGLPSAPGEASSLVTVNGTEIQGFWVSLLTVFSVLTMTLGNVMALRQSSFKRLLAYSSIAQAGYTLMGLAALQWQPPAAYSDLDIAAIPAGLHGQNMAIASIAFYMFMYTFTNLVVFGGIIYFTEKTGREKISDFAGLQRRSPWLALAMTIGLLSLGGIPPAAGFFGKLFLFQAAVNAGLVGLALIGVLNAIVGLYYYLVIIKVMYVDHGIDEDVPLPMPRAFAWTIGITTIVVIILGVAPAAIYDWAIQGAEAVRRVIGG